MNKPSCYPSECHTCESPECMVTLNCPVCGEEHGFNMYDEVYFIDCSCGAYIEITDQGEVWATDEDGEHEGGDAVTVAERTRRYHRDQQRDEISNGLMAMFRVGMEAAATGEMGW